MVFKYTIYNYINKILIKIFMDLADFGVASLFHGKEDKLNNAQGTYFFMSPEMCQKGDKEGFSGKNADIWALAVTFWAFTFLLVPFSGDTIAGILENVKNEEFKIVFHIRYILFFY